MLPVRPATLNLENQLSQVYELVQIFTRLNLEVTRPG